MRSRREIDEMMSMLFDMLGDETVIYKACAEERCGHYLDCLLWVIEERDMEDVIRGFPPRKETD